jgi:hypothetical protein
MQGDKSVLFSKSRKIAVLRVDVSVAELKKKIEIILQYIIKFCLVPLHKGEFFQRCQSLKH